MSAHRKLPPWMSAGGSGSSGKKGSGGKGLDRRMLYWMNERELLESALRCAHVSSGELRKTTVKPDVACPVEDGEVSVIPETDTEEELEAGGSVSDEDVAEQQTVPYITCVEKKRTNVRSDDSQATGDLSQRDETDPEALQLVREIFFS